MWIEKRKIGRVRITALTMCILCTLSLCGCAMIGSLFGGGDDTGIAEEPVDASVGFRRTVLYFETDDGQMVPVMKLLPWEEGIGRAALNQLVDTDTNRISAAAMGLKNVVPPGVSFVLSIGDDAIATVDILELPALADAQAEQNMITAVVNTLTEFSRIEQVEFLFDGKEKKKLPHGTAVNTVFSTQALNVEPLAVSAGTDEQYPVTLYFPNRAASLQIPVTRMVNTEPDLFLAMEQLAQGPADNSLRACFPANTEVLAAEIENDVVMVNFSQEFLALSDTPDIEQAAIASMQLTAKQFGEASALHIQVEGTDYCPASSVTMAVPQFANEYRL